MKIAKALSVTRFSGTLLPCALLIPLCLGAAVAAENTSPHATQDHSNTLHPGNSLSAEKLELFKITGITSQIEILESLVKEASQANAARCAALLNTENVAGYHADTLQNATAHAFAPMSESSTAEVMQWFRGTLAKQIHLAEIAEIDSTEFSNAIGDIRSDSARLNSISQIIENTRTMDVITLLGTEIEYAGLLHSGCIDKFARENPTAINHEQTLATAIRTDDGLTRILMQDSVTMELAYRLRTLTDDELEQYKVFSASASAQVFYNTLINAFTESLQNASNSIITTSGLDQ